MQMCKLTLKPFAFSLRLINKFSILNFCPSQAFFCRLSPKLPFQPQPLVYLSPGSRLRLCSPYANY